jgi:hypothetical protein
MKMNYLKIIQNGKQKVLSELRYHFLTKIIPTVAVSYCVYIIFKYKLYNFSKFPFSIQEEKLIGKKLYPILKFKNIDKMYELDDIEYNNLKTIYTNILKNLKLNLKNEVFLIKSDLCFLYILPTGSLFMSDWFYYLILYYSKESKSDLLSYFLIHNLVHIKLRHSIQNISGIYSKVSIYLF